MSKSLRYTIALLTLAFCLVLACTEAKKELHVKSHDNTLVITDPSKGYNAYQHWAVFPSDAVEYRRVVLNVTYRCPDSLHCGEWDYIDNIFIRRVGGSEAVSSDLELARMISPYGWRFDWEWEFTWNVDITDFAFLLHDSVEIEFNHTGYEKNDDRGWLITLDFEITEGTPAMQCLGMDTLWQGRFLYGDSANPIEDLLIPMEFSNELGADIARLRITQTGHGMDDLDNCAEFCSKYRQVLFDDSLVNQRQIWKKCGDNPLYPQAGTWIFDRAGWCPGLIVYPDQYDYPITPTTTHTVAIKMEPYVHTNNPTANYHIYAYLFYYAAPWAENDVTVEEIVAPSSADVYSRINPVCAEPRIKIKNNGRAELKSVDIQYGLLGGKKQTLAWTGNLASQRSAEITLPGLIEVAPGRQQFTVSLDSPNGVSDEYKADNELNSAAIMPPVYDTVMVLVFRTNNEPLHNSYTLTDGEGNLVRERALGTLEASTEYRDTLLLQPGCYEFFVVDTSGDGLELWFHPDGGYGYVRLLDMNGRLVKSFLSDCGSEIRHSFLVKPSAQPTSPVDEMPIVRLFPPRNQGSFTLDLFYDVPVDVNIRVLTADSTNTVFEKDYPNLKEGMVPIDISSEPDGTYQVWVTADNETISRRMRIRRQ